MLHYTEGTRPRIFFFDRFVDAGMSKGDWRTVRRRWKQLDKKNKGLAGLAVLFAYESVKTAVGVFSPPGAGTVAAFAVLAVVITVYYLFREVDLSDAAEGAVEDVTDDDA